MSDDQHVHLTTTAVPEQGIEPMSQPTLSELNETLSRLRVLLEESEFRRRGNNGMRIALATVLIFVTALTTSGSVSYCVTAPTPSDWCAIVPGITAREARAQSELRINNLENRIIQLESSR